MFYLIAGLVLAFLAIVAYLARLVFGPAPEPADDRPLVVPAGSIDADTEVFWPSRHHDDTVELVAADYQPPVYSRGFAAVVGYDRPSARPGQGADR